MLEGLAAAGNEVTSLFDMLKQEFETAKRFYSLRVRPALLQKNGVTEEQTRELGPRHAFRADDLIVKTLLLAALVPNVPALIGVDTEGIIRDNRHADEDSTRRKLIREMIWAELNLPDRMPTRKFQADPGTIRMIIDYPFDDADRYPADDVRRVHDIRGQLGEEDTIIWLPPFLSEDRKADLPTLIVISYLLERDRLAQVTPNLGTADRHHAKTQLEGRRSALTATLHEALRRAYGVISATDEDLGPRAAEQVLTLVRDLPLRIQGGQGMRKAFDGCGQLLSHRFPTHPDFDPNGSGAALRSGELEKVLAVVEFAAQDSVGRHADL